MTQGQRSRWHALVRYRLRSLLLLATAIAAALAAWAQWVEKPYEQEQAALDALDMAAAHVEFEDGGPSWLPGWVAKRFRRAVSLHLEPLLARDEHMEHVGRLVHLKRLWLDGTRVTDDGLRHLAGLTGLRRLSLRGTRVTDAGVKYLSAIPRLDALDVQQTVCTQTCLQYLVPERRMETLQFDFELDDRGVADLVRLTDQHDGNLRCSGLSLAALRELTRVRGIVNLSLRNMAIGTTEAKALAQLPDLVRLSIRAGSLVDRAVFGVLRSSSPLREVSCQETAICATDLLREFAPVATEFWCHEYGFSLSIHEPNLRVSLGHQDRGVGYDLRDLSAASELRSLRVERGINGTGLDFTGLANLEELAWLSAMSESQARQLGAMANLQRLFLRIEPALPPSAFEPLAELRNLETLSVAMCYLTDEHLKFLGGLTALRELDLASNPLTGDCLVHLANLPQLRRISLQGCKAFDEANLKHLAAIKSLADLTLQYTPVSDAGLKALHGMPNLRHVCVLGTRVTDEGLRALKAALPPGAEVY